MNSTFKLIAISFLILLLIPSCSNDDSDTPTPELIEGFRVVRLIGTAVGEMRSVPDIDGDGIEDMGNCFDLTLVDAYTGKILGTATDCLSEITTVGDGLALVGTAFFNFENGTVVTRGLTTVQPTTHGSSSMTHITGAIPTSTSNDILEGTGEFEGLQGGVRLSGAVNLSNIQSDNEITFNCVFVIPAFFNPEDVDSKRLVLRLVGTTVGETRLQDLDNDGVMEEANCFDVDLIDFRSGETIGTATDCLSDINGVGEGLALTGTTIFNLPDGQLISKGLTSVMPTTHGSEDITHITGAIPSDGDNNIIAGSGAYTNATGSARLSGAVNLSKIVSDNEVSFDCLFLIELD